jgi:hypothetical protein
MEITRFSEIMKRLTCANLPFMPKIDDLFIDTWYKFFENTDDKLFARAIFQIMTNESQYPSIPKVKEYLLREVRKMRESQKTIVYDNKPNPEAVLRIKDIINNSLKKIKSSSLDDKKENL